MHGKVYRYKWTLPWAVAPAPSHGFQGHSQQNVQELVPKPSARPNCSRLPVCPAHMPEPARAACIVQGGLCKGWHACILHLTCTASPWCCPAAETRRSQATAAPAPPSRSCTPCALQAACSAQHKAAGKQLRSDIKQVHAVTPKFERHGIRRTGLQDCAEAVCHARPADHVPPMLPTNDFFVSSSR